MHAARSNKIEFISRGNEKLVNNMKKQNTKLIVTPASRETLLLAVQDGTLQTLIKSGATITPPGCGVCFGALGGVPADGERTLTTTNRNFKGRTGNPLAGTYLASPATAAVTAIHGEISDPREVLQI